ncbi:MAG: hypothetical protein NC340_07455 [Ruminococcus flavefaciens]|nr:hypothetical protein [Ruminococcus flavefaciens]MCM1231630.1 hypothetical protein [Ruminococcus flavefaciens]
MYSELVKEIREKIDFRSGIFQEITPSGQTALLDVKYQHNIHLLLGYNGRIWYGAYRNGEPVTYPYSICKPDEHFFNSLQHFVNEIDDGKFNRKKTDSELVSEIISERRLTSCMNNTKWREFVHAMDDGMPCNVPFDLKTLFEDDPFELYDRFYDSECFNNYDFKSIEWVKVQPKFCDSIHRDMLIPDEKIPHDFTAEFVNLMKKYSIPYEYDESGVFIIYGYK